MDQHIKLETLIEKLKTAPQGVLDRVMGYFEGLMEKEAKDGFVLTDEHKEYLKRQEKVPLKNYIDAFEMIQNVERKHGL
ncbi:hypothetical protein [Chryseobacterium potabilaquae]|uniref:Uncharacterized protein n=1 Tax=Chryseobacterium potabilaquae TaxID=2675057 RepID=A0A6N4X7K3_9FLAO|nr:hypothetical protein [Chryseobacterium potabilaquae]CAA7196985.1 hypothetical protein CHRY9293_03043 [Chryseobacterium potabilaquae]